MVVQEPSVPKREIIEELLATLQELPGVHAHPVRRDVALANRWGRIDAEIDVTMADRQYRLIVEVKKSLFPRDVREALWQLKGYVRTLDPDNTIVPLLVAESISPGSKELLERENVGYYDSGGSLFIPARGVYVYIDKPPPKSFSRSVRVLFKGKRSQILHALLHDPKEWFSVKKLAEFARVSPATASETLSALERFDWLTSRGQGPSKERQLIQPAVLLDEWKKQIAASPKPVIRRYYVPGGDSEKMAEHLDQVCERRDLDYVLTQDAAAQRYAPFLSAILRVTCRMPPGRATDAALKELDAREVADGANLAVIETRSDGEFLFKERLGSVWLANPVQVYLDLQWASGRAPEMADHLRRQRIGS